MNIKDASFLSLNNKEQLSNSKTAGCFYCMKTFKPENIRHFVDDGNTALCPYCGIDMVLGDNSGFEISEKSLQEISDYFEKNKKPVMNYYYNKKSRD